MKLCFVSLLTEPLNGIYRDLCFSLAQGGLDIRYLESSDWQYLSRFPKPIRASLLANGAQFYRLLHEKREHHHYLIAPDDEELLLQLRKVWSSLEEPLRWVATHYLHYTESGLWRAVQTQGAA